MEEMEAMDDNKNHMGALYMGTQVHLLFSSWYIHSPFYYALALVAAFSVALVRELLLELRHRLIRHHKSYSQSHNNSPRPSLVVSTLSPLAGALTLLHVTTVFVSYLLMLIVMTFNLGLFLAILFGAGLGYLLFGLHLSTSPKPSNNNISLDNSTPI